MSGRKQFSSATHLIYATAKRPAIRTHSPFMYSRKPGHYLLPHFTMSKILSLITLLGCLTIVRRLYIYSAPVREQSIAMISLSVCRSVWVSVCTQAYLWNHWMDLRKNLCADPVAVAQSSPDGVALRYVLPVLWMTSRLAVIGHMAMRGRLVVLWYVTLWYSGRVWCLWMLCLWLCSLVYFYVHNVRACWVAPC